MGLRTVILKLHEPGKAKQKVMDEALINYNLALRFLLNKASSSFPELEEKFLGGNGRCNVLALTKWIDGDLSKELNKFAVQPFKDALKLDFASTVANYLRLGNTGSDAAFPAIRECPENAGRGKNHQSFGDFVKLYSIYFCRYDTKRSYCLLYNRAKDRYYVKLYLLNSANSRLTSDNSRNRDELEYIHKDGGMPGRSRKKEAYIIVPLSFGRWQEKFLKEAAEAPERFKTARLFKKKNEYYIAVSMETGGTGEIKTAAFMGVSRGLENKLNYTVVSLTGEILSSGPVKSREKDQNAQEIPIDELHASANFIAETAAFYKAQVIVQNLAGRGDGLSWLEDGQNQWLPGYKRKDYNRLIRLLDYKLPWRNLPPPVKVSAVNIFHHCWNCGLTFRKNRVNESLFICTGCGTTMDIDRLGSLNLARKLISYHGSKIKIKLSKEEEGIRFTNSILGLDFFAGNRENQLEALRNEISRIINAAKVPAEPSKGEVHRGRASLIKKLEIAGNFMDLLEYI